MKDFRRQFLFSNHCKHLILIFVATLVFTNWIRIQLQHNYNDPQNDMQHNYNDLDIETTCQQIANLVIVEENTTSCASRAELIDYANINELNPKCSTKIWAAVRGTKNETILIWKPVSLLPQFSKKSFRISKKGTWIPKLEMFYEKLSLEHDEPTRKIDLNYEVAICIQEKGLV